VTLCLKENAFIAALPAAECTLVTKHLLPFDLQVGQRLHGAGDIDADVIFPHSGLIALVVRGQSDGAAGVALVGRDGVVGGFTASMSVPASSDAEVHIAGRATRMAAPVFRELVDCHPTIRRLAARFDCAMIAQSQQTAYCNTVHPVEARVCRWLAEILDRSDEAWVPLNQAALAEILSVRRTTITLVVGRLEAAGVLRWRRGYADILDRAELGRRSCGCYAHMRGYVRRLFPPADIERAPAQSAMK
jgi:CRP-like cAMP-binding protein